ncbi:MAG: S8 family peptidase [Luteolibacter sp.]
MKHWIWLTPLFLIATVSGYWLARTAVPAPRIAVEEVPPRISPTPADAPMPAFRRGERPPANPRDHEAIDAGAVANQRVIAFSSREALEAFLARAGDGIEILGRLDALLALRVGFRDADALAALLDGNEELSMIFPVEIPMPGNVGAQAGAVPLENALLAWLGIDGMPAAGDGVRIAILDTGVDLHRWFSENIHSINLVERLAEINGHGTAVASMILGQHRLAPGVAPNASIIDIRIANDFGASNSWLLAEGILAAVNAGAHIINISLGSTADSALVRNALAYAQAAGVIVVAAAGNQGLDRVAYPAGNPGVLAVGATDATGRHVAFSNSGNIDVSAPGFGINAAWPGDTAVNVHGTSFSAPIISGALAWIMSTQNVNATQAVALMNQYLNDAGAAGHDPAHGGGLPALDRVANGTTPGIFDAAVASHHVIAPSPGKPYAQLEVVVQNRGTEPLLNTTVTIQHPGGTTTANITSLPPGGVQPVFVPIPNVQYDSGQPLAFDSRVSISQGITDANPANDRRTDIHLQVESP